MPFDKQLQQAVLTELDWKPRVVAGYIGVTANAGIVTLTGHVASFTEKCAAETATHRVKAVAEEINDDIAAPAIERLAWEAAWAAPGATSVENDIAIL